jgi:hypothetical protein
MSAVIGILNKHAIALAADSAVTISREDDQKIFNTANKIFTLSKYHPIGVMIYDSSNFMNTPWEILIKVYREQLGKNSFPTVEEYYEDFLQFLDSKEYYLSEEEEKEIIKGFFNKCLGEIIDSALGNYELPEPEQVDQDDRDEIKDILEAELDRRIDSFSDDNICLEFEDYTQRAFSVYTNDLFEAELNRYFSGYNFTFSDNYKRKIRKYLYQQVISKDFKGYYTSGLVFVGYGDEQIYPKLIPLKISFAVDGKLRFYVEEEMITKISNTSHNAAIRPFAQTDVINTILTGVAPDLQTIMARNFDNYLEKYNNLLVDKLEDVDPDIAEVVDGIDLSKISEEYRKTNSKIQNLSHIRPLMKAVSSLSKEDLAEMAESLIYLTYLKRRFTFDEESVGGPVDVALITKGDGFIWMKRKHYFDPELNHQFFKTYLK